MPCYVTRYESPIGMLLLSSDGECVTGVWMEGQRYYAASVPTNADEVTDSDIPVLKEAKNWLNRYFAGERPTQQPPLRPHGTVFEKEVWTLLGEIPYGDTVSYGEIAKRLAERRGVAKMSAQAVGGAVGRNPIAILIPCHRVVGRDGRLTGYAGGLERKKALLEMEKSR